MTDGPEVWVPRPYQEDCRTAMIDNLYKGIYGEPGIGKTAVSLSVAQHFKERTLVIVPINPMYGTWPSQIKKWAQFNSIKYTILHGPDKERNFLKNTGVYFINPHGMKWLHGMIKKHRRFPWKVLIVDESKEFKNFNSKRFEYLCDMLPVFKRRYILTGNLTPNSYFDVWAQAYILDLGKEFGDNFYKFRKKYFAVDPFQRFNWELQLGAEEIIKEKIAKLFVYVPVKGNNDLPKRIVNDIRLELTPELKVQYQKVKKKLAVEFYGGEYGEDLDGFEVVPSSSGTAILKGWQMANGFVYETLSEEDRLAKRRARHRIIHDIKAQRAREIVDDLGGSPCIIVYYFKPDLEILRQHFPEAEIVESGSNLVDLQDRWNAGKIPILLSQGSKISHGLNLQEGPGHTIIFYSLFYNFDTYDQIIRRIERQGSLHDHVMVHRLLMNGTTDEAIVHSLDNKCGLKDGIIYYLESYREAA